MCYEQVLRDLRKGNHVRQRGQPFQPQNPPRVEAEHPARPRDLGGQRLHHERLHALPAQRQSTARSLSRLDFRVIGRW